jgi:hypothetical protein
MFEEEHIPDDVADMIERLRAVADAARDWRWAHKAENPVEAAHDAEGRLAGAVDRLEPGDLGEG